MPASDASHRVSLLLPMGQGPYGKRPSEAFVDDERQNLLGLLPFLQEARADFFEVIAVEQHDEQSPTSTRLSLLPDWVQKRSVPSKRLIFERARLLNIAANVARGDILWIHDVDLLLPFNHILREIKKQTRRAIGLHKPFSYFLRQSRGEAMRLVEPEAHDKAEALAQNVAALEEDGQKKEGESAGKASFLVDRSLFLALGGMHEGLVGEADPGFEFIKRYRIFFERFDTSKNIVGVLQRRALSENQRSQRKQNQEMRKRLSRHLEKDVPSYFAQHLQSPFQPSPQQDLTRLAIQMKREDAWHVVSATPVPRREKRLPGSLWGLTTHFNPARYKNKKQNYDRFLQGMLEAGLPILTVELAFEEHEFELEHSEKFPVLQVRGGDVLWQKERLLNVGIAALPNECDKVVWLDGDVLFEDKNWAEKTADMLEKYVMVQPFSRSIRLLPGEEKVAHESLPVGSGEHEVLHSIAFGVYAKGQDCLTHYLEHGHSGYAWAGRRDVLQKHLLYDANILGNADLNIAHAMYGGPDYLRKTRLSEKASAHLDEWAQRFHNDVQGSVGYVEGMLFHLWHGSKEARRYHERLTVLQDNDFDPDRDLSIGPSGAYLWGSEKPALHAWCSDYFAQRKEESTT